jgi:hypothetical protein
MVGISFLAEMMVMFEMENLVCGIILQHRLRASDAQGAVPPWIRR